MLPSLRPPSPRHGHVARVLRPPRLRRRDVASRCTLHKGHHDIPEQLLKAFGCRLLKRRREEDQMSTSKKPLKPDDFPVNADGQKIKKQDGTPIANTEDSAVAADVAERLNDDEARREEDKWSA